MYFVQRSSLLRPLEEFFSGKLGKIGLWQSNYNIVVSSLDSHPIDVVISPDPYWRYPGCGILKFMDYERFYLAYRGDTPKILLRLFPGLIVSVPGDTVEICSVVHASYDAFKKGTVDIEARLRSKGGLKVMEELSLRHLVIGLRVGEMIHDQYGMLFTIWNCIIHHRLGGISVFFCVLLKH